MFLKRYVKCAITHLPFTIWEINILRRRCKRPWCVHRQGSPMAPAHLQKVNRSLWQSWLGIKDLFSQRQRHYDVALQNIRSLHHRILLCSLVSPPALRYHHGWVYPTLIHCQNSGLHEPQLLGSTQAARPLLPAAPPREIHRDSRLEDLPRSDPQQC